MAIYQPRMEIHRVDYAGHWSIEVSMITLISLYP